MKKNYFIFPLLCIFLVSCSHSVKSTGSIKITLPENNARAAASPDGFSYEVTFVSSDGTIGPVTVNGGETLVQHYVPVGSCKVSVDAFYPNKDVPAFSGSATVDVDPFNIAEAKIVLKANERTDNDVRSIKFKMKDDAKLIINNLNWDNILISRTYVDGSSDRDYFPAKDKYSLKFDSIVDGDNYVGYLPVILTDKSKNEFTITVPAYFSMNKFVKDTDFFDFSDDKDDKKPETENVKTAAAGEQIETAETNVQTTVQNQVETNSEDEPVFENYTLNYIDKNGIKTQVEVVPDVESIVWYVVTKDGEETKSEKISEDKYFDPTTYFKDSGKYSFSFDVVFSNSTLYPSNCKVEDWIVDNEYHYDDYSVLIYEQKGENKPGVFVYYDYIDIYKEPIDFQIYTVDYNSFMVSSRDINQAKAVDSTILCCVDNGELQEIEATIEDAVYEDGDNILSMTYTLQLDDLTPGQHTLFCIMILSDGTYVYDTISFTIYK